MLSILYIYRNPAMGFSIGKVFKPIEIEMRKYANVDSIYLPESNYKPLSLWRNIRYVREIIAQKHYDVVHITGTEHYLIPFLKIKNRVITVHDLGRLDNLKGLKKFRYKLLQVYPLRFAKKVVCISSFTISEIKKSIEIDDNKLIVIPDSLSNDYNESFNVFNNEKPIILHIGTRPHKNLSRTIQALKNQKCHIRIIGNVSDDDLQQLKETNVDYSIASNLTDEELINEYKKADIINFPSYHEGFGMPIIEGQAIGRVVITSTIEPMRTVAGENAILCDPYNVDSIMLAYTKVFSDEKLRTKAIRCGLENVKQYRPNIIAQKYYDLYKSLL